MWLCSPALEEMTKAGSIKRLDDLWLDLGNVKSGFGLLDEVSELGSNDLNKGEPA